MVSEIAAGALSVVLLLLVVFWMRRVLLRAADAAWRPPNLQGAELIYVERAFKSRSLIQLVARVDRAYRQPNGFLVLVEFKTRRVNRTYFSDIIELSAQRLAVEAQTGERVDDYGYVLVQAERRSAKVPHRVRLLPVHEVIALARRREAILTGNSLPQFTRYADLCRQCAFEQECRADPTIRRSPMGKIGLAAIRPPRGAR